jgi:putative ABC transport system permease protein
VRARNGGGVPARRAVVRWAGRMLRREWRQQVLVLALLTVAVAAAVAATAVGYNAPSSSAADFGTATVRYELDASDPEAASADVATFEDRFGTIDVIGHRSVPVPGSTEDLDVRDQDPDGPYSGPMLSLRDGRYPTGPGETALTDKVATLLDADVGSRVALGRTERTVVGIVENPADLGDEFALVPPGAIGGGGESDIVAVLAKASIDDFLSEPALPTERFAEERDTTEGEVEAAGVLALATIAMLLVALVAAAGFVVAARRRLRQLGLLAAVGATEKHLRLVMLANGMLVGLVAAVLGTAGGLAAWLAMAPRLEGPLGHRIDRFAVPWWLFAAGFVLAVGTATAAAWWPARTTARVPVTAALSARPSPPRSVRRSALVAGLLVALGVAGIATGLDVRHDTANVPLLLGGMVALVAGVLLVGPLAIRVVARLGARSPIAVRLALRDLARYQARSGAALAAISLAVGIAASVVVVANARAHEDAGNLSDRQLLVRLGDDPDPDRSPAELEDAAGQVDRMADQLDDPSVVALDVAVDPASDPTYGPSAVAVARPIDESTYRYVAEPYVATPALLAHYGVDAAAVDPGTEVLTGLPVPRDPVYVNTASPAGPPAVAGIAHVDVPDYSAAPNTFVTPEAVRRHGWRTARAGWLVESARPLTGEQIATATDLAAGTGASAGAGLTVETRDDGSDLAAVRAGATAAGALLALGILAMTIGLIRSEVAGDLRILAATGASGRVRRTVTASTAGVLGLLGVVLGVAGTYVALVAGYSDDLARLGAVPVPSSSRSPPPSRSSPPWPATSSPAPPPTASSPHRRRRDARSGDGAGRDQPLGRLPGDLGDQIEVVVVVEYHEIGGFGRGRDEQVGDLGPPVLTLRGKGVLHVDRSIEHRLVHGDERPRDTGPAHRPMRSGAAGGETRLQISRRAAGHQPALEQGAESGGHLVVVDAGQR